MRTNLVHFFVVSLSSCLLISLSPCLRVASAPFDEIIDSPMYKAPDIPASQVVMVFPEKAKDLWLKALEQPEADMKCKVADAIALAQRRGVKGLETTIDPLLAVLDREGQPLTVRLAIARTLIALDAKKAAPRLIEQVQAGAGDLSDIIEPALARWDYQPARAMWLSRLQDPATPPRSLILAIQCLAAVHEKKAADRLLEIVLLNLRKDAKDRLSIPPSIQMEAARALGSLREEDLEKDAERLAEDASPRGLVGRLAAALVLQQHQSKEAVRQLQHLAEDPEPAVVALAAARFLAIDPDLIVPKVERILASSDPKVRSLGVEILFQRPTDKHLRLLSHRLDDVDPEVRQKARQHLKELAVNKKLRDQILTGATEMLAKQQWRGLEQAAILLTLLDHKPAASRLVELLSFDRPEVFITAAWSLRQLAVAETLPDVVKYVEAQQARVRAAAKKFNQKEVPVILVDHQLSQLNQFLGRQKYGPADSVLRKFIKRMEGPRQPVVCAESRAAAIWALGMIHEGRPDVDLVAAVEERLGDIATVPPEDPRVRRMAAITLGRIQAKQALDSLRQVCPDQETTTDPVTNACGWAIQQLTGKVLSPPTTIRRIQRDWFLSPRD